MAIVGAAPGDVQARAAKVQLGRPVPAGARRGPAECPVPAGAERVAKRPGPAEARPAVRAVGERVLPAVEVGPLGEQAE